jgi:anti-anti-sigma regulatory factor
MNATSNALFRKIDMDCTCDRLRQVLVDIHTTVSDAVLDFSSVQKLATRDLEVLQEIVLLAEERGVKIALCGVNAKIYKVLKLARLAQRFGFVTTEAAAAE